MFSEYLTDPDELVSESSMIGLNKL